MTSKEIYEKYKGCLVTDGTYTGTIIGYWKVDTSAETILIGISNHEEKKGWFCDDINNHQFNASNSIMPEYIDPYKYETYRYISKSKIRLISETTCHKNITETIDEIGEKWLKSLKEFQDIDEESANLLLNGFLSGIKEGIKYSNSIKNE